MKTINKKIGISFLAAVSGILFLSSCNKDLEQASAITPESGISVGQAIAANSNYSIFNAALVRTGIAASLKDSASNFTVFVPDDAAMALSGISLAVVEALPIANLTALVQYHIVGSKVPSSLFSVPFPNLRIPTTMALDPANALVRMSSFPSMLTAFSYVNATQITAVDQIFNNGVIHNVATALSPTTRFLKAAIAADTALAYFRAAIARGDVGSTGLSRLDSLLNYGPVSMTVLTPNNAAFKPLLKGLLTQFYVANGSSLFSADSLANIKSAVDSLGSPTAGFNVLPIANVRGVVAYHFLATQTPGGFQPIVRIFSVNVPSTPAFVKTLVNGSVSFHPGVEAAATFSGPIASAVTFRGYTPTAGGPVATGVAANVIKKDNHNINGVYHIIDRVLLPQ